MRPSTRTLMTSLVAIGGLMSVGADHAEAQLVVTTPRVSVGLGSPYVGVAPPYVGAYPAYGPVAPVVPVTPVYGAYPVRPAPYLYGRPAYYGPRRPYGYGPRPFYGSRGGYRPW